MFEWVVLPDLQVTKRRVRIIIISEEFTPGYDTVEKSSIAVVVNFPLFMGLREIYEQDRRKQNRICELHVVESFI